MKLRSFKVTAGQAPVSKTGVAVLRFGLIDRGIRRRLRCRDTCGLLPESLAIYRWVV